MNIAHPSSVSDRSQVPNLLISDAFGMMLRYDDLHINQAMAVK